MKKYTNEELIEEIKRFVAKYGHTPTKTDTVREIGFPSHFTFRKHFGSFNKAIEAAGFTPQAAISQGEKRVSNDEMIMALEMKVRELGYIPSYYDLQKENFRPNPGLYRDRFGSLQKALSQTTIRYSKTRYFILTAIFKVDKVIERFCSHLSNYFREKIE